SRVVEPIPAPAAVDLAANARTHGEVEHIAAGAAGQILDLDERIDDVRYTAGVAAGKSPGLRHIGSGQSVVSEATDDVENRSGRSRGSDVEGVVAAVAVEGVSAVRTQTAPVDGESVVAGATADLRRAAGQRALDVEGAAARRGVGTDQQDAVRSGAVGERAAGLRAVVDGGRRQARDGLVRDGCAITDPGV